MCVLVIEKVIQEMSVQNNVNFQGKVPQSEKRSNTASAMIGAPLLTAMSMTYPLFSNKELRKDTFFGTTKECVKLRAKEIKDLLYGGAKKILRNEKLADKITKIPINNKRFAAIAVALNVLADFALLKLAYSIGSKIRHRKD